MKILIAESKTMRTDEENISIGLYERHTPAGEEYASEIMRNICDLSLPEIMEEGKLSRTMAERLKQLAYEFPNKTAGLKAIEAFTGVVFRHFDFSSLSEEEKNRAANEVAIISSLYGWLKPEDIIKPYRMEYTSTLSPDDTPLWKFWRGKVTIQLVRALQTSGETEILNLLPADAAKCIDWKLVKRFAKVWKVDFLEQTGETVKSPHAGRLKALRGELLREIITTGISNSRQLLSFSNSNMLPIENYKYSDRVAFMV